MFKRKGEDEEEEEEEKEGAIPVSLKMCYHKAKVSNKQQ